MQNINFSLVRTWKTGENVVNLSFKKGSSYEEGLRIEITSQGKTRRIALESIESLPMIPEKSPLEKCSLEEIGKLFDKCYPRILDKGDEIPSIRFIDNCFEGMKISVLVAQQTTTMQCQDETITICLGEKNSELILGANPNDTINQIGDKVRNETGSLAEGEINLSYQGEVLMGNRTLVSYEISEKACLVQLEEDSQESINKCSFGFNDLSQQTKINFLPGAPDYHRIDCGLNLLGRCKNAKCEPVNKYVWIQKGIGGFNIGKEINNSACPACGEIAEEVNNLGFWNCKFEIEGYRNSEKMVFKQSSTAPRDRFTTFEEGKSLTNWCYLEVKTSDV